MVMSGMNAIELQKAIEEEDKLDKSSDSLVTEEYSEDDTSITSEEIDDSKDGGAKQINMHNLRRKLCYNSQFNEQKSLKQSNSMSDLRKQEADEYDDQDIEDTTICSNTDERKYESPDENK